MHKYKIFSVTALPNFTLFLVFSNGEARVFDVKPLIENFKPFSVLDNNFDLFSLAYPGLGGDAVIWNDDLDYASDALYEGSIPVKTILNQRKGRQLSHA